MVNVLVRDISEHTHRELMRRAVAQGQSLQQYLAAELARLADTPTLQDVMARIDARSGGRVGLDQAVADLAAERPSR